MDDDANTAAITSGFSFRCQIDAQVSSDGRRYGRDLQITNTRVSIMICTEMRQSVNQLIRLSDSQTVRQSDNQIIRQMILNIFGISENYAQTIFDTSNSVKMFSAKQTVTGWD